MAGLVELGSLRQVTDPSLAPILRRWRRKRGARPPEAGTERETLEGMLGFLRATVVVKVAGLTDEQALAAPVPPSVLTPAGVVKHLTGTERFWFSIDFADDDVTWPWTDEDPHGGFALADDDTLADLVTDYLAECGRSRTAAAGYALDERAPAAWTCTSLFGSRWHT